MGKRKEKIAFLTRIPPNRRYIRSTLPICLDVMEKETRHYWMATSVMAMLRYHILSEKLSSHLIEGDGPYNLLVELTNGEEFSCYCSGFNKYIDVQRIIPRGKPDPNFEEKRFTTPIGVINFLKKVDNGR